VHKCVSVVGAILPCCKRRGYLQPDSHSDTDSATLSKQQRSCAKG